MGGRKKTQERHWKEENVEIDHKELSRYVVDSDKCNTFYGDGWGPNLKTLIPPVKKK